MEKTKLGKGWVEGAHWSSAAKFPTAGLGLESDWHLLDGVKEVTMTILCVVFVIFLLVCLYKIRLRHFIN